MNPGVMARKTEVVLLLILAISSMTSAEVWNPLSGEYFKELVQESITHTEGLSCNGNRNCPVGWVEYNGRCFSYHGDKMDWASAEKHCLKFGANLISIHDENEYQLAKALVRAYDPSEPPTWLGLSNCQKRNNWFWSDGSMVTFTKWDPEEPNSSGGECCVHMNWEKQGQKDWNDFQCYQSCALLCAKRINRNNGIDV